MIKFTKPSLVTLVTLVAITGVTFMWALKENAIAPGSPVSKPAVPASQPANSPAAPASQTSNNSSNLQNCLSEANRKFNNYDMQQKLIDEARQQARAECYRTYR